MPQQKKFEERFTISMRTTEKEWLEEQVQQGKFDSLSQAIRGCVKDKKKDVLQVVSDAVYARISYLSLQRKVPFKDVMYVCLLVGIEKLESEL